MTVSTVDWHARVGEAPTAAEKASERATVLMEASRSYRDSSMILRHRALGCRADSRPLHRWFRLEGGVDETPVVAVMRGDQVIADERLLVNARVVVAMGESFNRENGEVIQASLEGPPVSVMLTLIRACSYLTSVRLGPAEHPDLWGERSPGGTAIE